jgi:tetratricopeptide (TPR) repeat protein
MSHERSDSKTRPLAAGLLAICLTLSCMERARAESPQDGSVSASDATLLWNRANEAYEGNDFATAAHLLRRLVERIPTHPHALQAQKLLGESELRLGNFDAAKAAFGTFLSNTRSKGEMSLNVKWLLAETHLQSGHPTDALLIADSLNSRAEAPGDQAAWRRPLDSQIHKTRALLAMGQLKRSRSALEAARKRSLEDSADPSWARNWLASLGIQLQSAECRAFAPAGFARVGMSEDQVLDRLGRHGLCMQRLRNLGQKLQASASLASVQAAASVDLAENTYRTACSTPPPPREGVRSPEELAAYSLELRRRMLEVCQASGQGKP